MPRRTNAEMDSIKKLIEKVIVEKKETSPTKIGQILKDDYNINISKETLLNICKEMTTYSVGMNKGDSIKSGIELEYEDNPEIIKINERIKKLEKDFDNSESPADRHKFNDALNDTQESKLRMKKILREAEMLKRNSDKAQYFIKFGEPQVIKTDIIKKPFFKTDDKQKPLPIKEGDA